MVDSLLQKRWRSLRRKVRHRVQDAQAFTHPAVKFVIVAILAAITIAAVVYALREDPANHPPESTTESSPATHVEILDPVVMSITLERSVPTSAV